MKRENRIFKGYNAYKRYGILSVAITERHNARSITVVTENIMETRIEEINSLFLFSITVKSFFL